VQRTAPSAARDLGFRVTSRGERLLPRDRDERIDRAIESIDSRQARLRQLQRRRRFSPEELGCLLQRQRGEIRWIRRT